MLVAKCKDSRPDTSGNAKQHRFAQRGGTDLLSRVHLLRNRQPLLRYRLLPGLIQAVIAGYMNSRTQKPKVFFQDSSKEPR